MRSDGASETAISYPLVLPAQRWKRIPKLLLGELLVGLLPGRAGRVLRDGDPMHFNRLDRLLLAGWVARARRSGDWDALNGVQQRFWAGRGGALFARVGEVAARFEQRFLRHHLGVVDALERELAGAGFAPAGLCEIGSGNGLALDYLSRRLGSIPQFIGLDLNPEAARANAARWPAPRLRFVTGEAVAWLEAHAEPGWVYFSNAGVLEYLTQAQLDRLLGLLAARPPALFALVEPLAPDHDLERELDSRSFGAEFTNSHNHPARFRRAGWEIRFQQEVRVGALRHLLLVARKIG
ncbi:MAG: class I SAM-dependent methyltransferase [Stagnimonas sp.]|nr:class I SAM-dependent methyltransferase [Stagnimonas sp.]